MLITLKLFAKYLNSHIAVKSILILFNKNKVSKKWPCGYLGVPIATNVASKKILLVTANVDQLIAMFLER